MKKRTSLATSLIQKFDKGLKDRILGTNVSQEALNKFREQEKKESVKALTDLLDMKYFKDYIRLFNLTEYKILKRVNKEMEYLYKLYRFNQTGIESPLLIDYSSSLPHYPLFANYYHKCFIRGEIISLLNNIINLTCIDISGINFIDNDFSLRISLLDKNSSDIKLYILKEINVKKEIENKYGKRNVIFYENDNMTNLRYCSNEFSSLSQYYINMPKNYILVMEISWKKRAQYFCLRNISLIYN